MQQALQKQQALSTAAWHAASLKLAVAARHAASLEVQRAASLEPLMRHACCSQTCSKPCKHSKPQHCWHATSLEHTASLHTFGMQQTFDMQQALALLACSRPSIQHAASHNTVGMQQTFNMQQASTLLACSRPSTCSKPQHCWHAADLQYAASRLLSKLTL